MESEQHGRLYYVTKLTYLQATIEHASQYGYVSSLASELFRQASR
jgi:hypothetical protein